MRIITFLNTKTSGKTTLLANFAVALARKAQGTVALVDLNIHTPELAHYFNLIDEQSGIYPISLDEIFRYLTSGEEFEIEKAVTPIKSVHNLSLICGPRDMREEFSLLKENQWKYFLCSLTSFDFVLIDTPRYQNSSLFKVLLKESEKLILVQDQDLFGSYHTSQFVLSASELIKDKLDFWVSRYEENSPVKPAQIEEIISLKAKHIIPGIPRYRYIQGILNEKPLGHDLIPNYSNKLEEITNEILGIESKQKAGKSWKFWTWKKKLIVT